MPLFFTLHGLLWRWTGDGLTTGLVLLYLSGLLVLSGVYGLLRHQHLQRRVALPLTGLLLGTVTFQKMSVELRGDVLASGAVLWAVLCAEKSLRRGSAKEAWIVAAGFWTLVAFFTKFTSIYILVFLAWRLRSRVFVGVLLTLGTAGLALFQWLSAGHFWENFAPVATGGMSLSWDTLPLAFQAFGDGLMYCDPLAYILCLVPIVVSMRALWHRWRSKTDDLALAWPGQGDQNSAVPFQLLLALVTVITIGIFSSPGTWINHFVDLLAFSVLVLGRMFLPQAMAWRVIAGRTCLFYILFQLVMLIPGAPSARQSLSQEGVARIATVEEIHRRYLPPGTVYVADNPMVAVAVGDRPFVLDEFNLRTFLREGHPVGQDFYQKVCAGFFQMAVFDSGPLESDFDAPPSLQMTEEYWASRPPEFRFMRDYFVLVAVHRPFAVLAWRRPSEP
jgi:hypothetical protein